MAEKVGIVTAASMDITAMTIANSIMVKALFFDLNCLFLYIRSSAKLFYVFCHKQEYSTIFEEMQTIYRQLHHKMDKNRGFY